MKGYQIKKNQLAFCRGTSHSYTVAVVYDYNQLLQYQYN